MISNVLSMPAAIGVVAGLGAYGYNRSDRDGGKLFEGAVNVGIGGGVAFAALRGASQLGASSAVGRVVQGAGVAGATLAALGVAQIGLPIVGGALGFAGDAVSFVGGVL